MRSFERLLDYFIFALQVAVLIIAPAYFGWRQWHGQDEPYPSELVFPDYFLANPRMIVYVLIAMSLGGGLVAIFAKSSQRLRQTATLMAIGIFMFACVLSVVAALRLVLNTHIWSLLLIAGVGVMASIWSSLMFIRFWKNGTQMHQ